MLDLFIYYYKEHYSKALEHFYKALKLSEELGDKQAITIHIGNVGNVYQK